MSAQSPEEYQWKYATCENQLAASCYWSVVQQEPGAAAYVSMIPLDLFHDPRIQEFIKALQGVFVDVREKVSAGPMDGKTLDEWLDIALGAFFDSDIRLMGMVLPKLADRSTVEYCAGIPEVYREGSSVNQCRLFCRYLRELPEEKAASNPSGEVAP